MLTARGLASYVAGAATSKGFNYSRGRLETQSAEHKKNEVNRIVQSIKQNRFRCKTPMFALKKARQFNYPKLIIRSGVEQVRKQESMLEKVFVVV